MKLLCFQAKRFRWKSHSKSLTDVLEQKVEEEVSESLIVFIQAEATDEETTRKSAVLRQTLKHLKWLANKRKLKNIVLHSFAHLGGNPASAPCAESILSDLRRRLLETGYEVWVTPFGYSCEWDLSVYGESLAKVWKEIH